MKYGLSQKFFGWFFHGMVKSEIKRSYPDKVKNLKAIKEEYIATVKRAKDIGKSRLMSAYCLGAYFIAMNRVLAKTEPALTPEQNYEIVRDGMASSKLFKKAMGTPEKYLDPRQRESRKKWEEESHLRKYENDWVVDVLDKTDEYELGYDYLECGICKLCRDEGCRAGKVPLQNRLPDGRFNRRKPHAHNDHCRGRRVLRFQIFIKKISILRFGKLYNDIAIYQLYASLCRINWHFSHLFTLYHFCGQIRIAKMNHFIKSQVAI